MTELLGGVRVLDLTTVLAGPFASYQLSLMGADVIKVEVPNLGDLARDMGDDEILKNHSMGTSFVSQNAGKRSITLDLKNEEGRRIFERLVRSTDVLLENMRPGTLERLGFSWPRLHELNPELIYCAITGFGQTGPLAGRPAYDQIIQGLAGMADVTGWPDGGPLRVGFPICDTLGGLAATSAVCAALAKRSHDRQGCFLDVSMLETALVAMGYVVSEYLIGGRIAQRIGNDNAASSPSGTFETGDGLINIATNTQKQFEAVCNVCGRLDLIDDDRFLTRRDRKRNRRVLGAELESALRSRSALDWETLFESVSVPAGRVLTLDEALHQDQITVRGLLHEVEVTVPESRTVTVLGSGVHVDGQTLTPSAPPPRLGEHTREILAELGFSEEEVEGLHDRHVV